ncbi:unnamed protein product [Lepeophtheirus salmonis]|uniref:(salmon louse) hypothetical protein n=1 Tax=Lepeophtheirus salmonis TaxID=72036 RepID=A0A7R8CLN6_LEPSM|nr:unnamed protein product [Lepeophtheirus salmonis]CAF2814645.1 unnamed protein product [Lepeophtheirus salmonis]
MHKTAYPHRGIQVIQKKRSSPMIESLVTTHLNRHPRSSLTVARPPALSKSSNINLSEQPSGTVINLISSTSITLEPALRIIPLKDLHIRRRITRALSTTYDIANESIKDDVMSDFSAEDKDDDIFHEISESSGEVFTLPVSKRKKAVSESSESLNPPKIKAIPKLATQSASHPSVQSPTVTLNSPEVVILPDIPSAPDSRAVQLEPAASSDVPSSNVQPCIVKRLPVSLWKCFGTNFLEPLSVPHH